MLSSLPILLSLSAAVVVPAQAALVEHYWSVLRLGSFGKDGHD
jgi:hypothetical protein